MTPKNSLRITLCLCTVVLLLFGSVREITAGKPTAQALITDRANLPVSNQFGPPGPVRLSDTGDVFFAPRLSFFHWDATNDGIQAVANETQIDAALWVRGAHQVVVENLKLTGGFTGLLATEVTTPFLIMRNCRLEGNNFFGVTLEASLLQAEDTVFDSNGSFNAGVFLGSRFGCNGCTLSNPGGGVGPTVRTNLLMLTGSSAVVGNTTFSNGGVALNNSSAVIFDSSIDAFAPNASLAASEGILSLTRVQIGGPMRLFQGSNASLFGVTQSRSETPNSVDDNSFLKIGDAPPATGGPPSIASVILDITLRNFSNASLLQTSQINGNLNCNQEANTFCGNPANVSGTSNCALCPKP